MPLGSSITVGQKVVEEVPEPISARFKRRRLECPVRLFGAAGRRDVMLA